MKLALKFIVLGISLSMFYACTGDDDTEAPIISIKKIMPLGASRVEGNRPEFESYRYELWKDLVDGNFEFDFIGTRSDDASYPTYKDNDFDPDHEGRYGWTSEQILNDLDNWLSITGSPDIVLISAPGGNDALQGLPYDQAVININSIIDLLQSNNPNVIIVIEQLAPALSAIMSVGLTEFFENINQEVLNIATNQTTSTSKVIAVDMFTGFNDSYLADNVHYNQAGADFIATRYYDIIKNFLE